MQARWHRHADSSAEAPVRLPYMVLAALSLWVVLWSAMRIYVAQPPRAAPLCLCPEVTP